MISLAVTSGEDMPDNPVSSSSYSSSGRGSRSGGVEVGLGRVSISV